MASLCIERPSRALHRDLQRQAGRAPASCGDHLLSAVQAKDPCPRNPCWQDTEWDLSSRWGWVSPSPFPPLQGHQLSGFHVCKLPDSQIRGCLPCTFHLRSGQQSWTRFPHSGAGVWLWGRPRLHCELPDRMEVPGAQVLPYNVWGSLYIRRSGPTVGPAGCTAVGPPGKRRARCRCWAVGWGFSSPGSECPWP